MSFSLRLCLGLIILLPSLAQAATLGNPSNNLSYSGVGVVSGWKCEANGSLTARFFDEDMLPLGDPLPLVYGTERTDVLEAGACDSANVGFVAIWNWGNLSDGTYTAIAYDDDVEFARSTFTVTTFGTAFLTGASGECRLPDFPMPGETTTFAWNQATQHLEAVSREPSIDIDACIEALTVESGAMCNGSIYFTTPLGEISTGFTFSVDADGQGCVKISGSTSFDNCHPASLPEVLEEVGVSVTRNEDGSWTIHRFPAFDLGSCEVDLTVNPGTTCSGSIDIPLGDIDYTFSVEADGEGCIEAEIPLVDDIDECFDTTEELEDVLDEIGDVIDADIDASATRNADGSWTITDLF